MFKLAIISTLAASAVNALEIDADAAQFRHRRAGPQGLAPRSFVLRQKRGGARIGNIGSFPRYGPSSDLRSIPGGKLESRAGADKAKRGGPVVSFNDKEENLHERLTRFDGKRVPYAISKTALRRGFGGRRGRYGAPRRPRDGPKRETEDPVSVPSFFDDFRAPLRDSEKLNPLRGNRAELRGLEPLRGNRAELRGLESLRAS